MITFEGREYENFDPDHVSIDEWREVKRKLGLTIRQTVEGMRQIDPDAFTAIYWLVMRSDGKHDDLVLDADMQFDIAGFLAAFIAATDDSEPPDPTGGSATPPSSSSSTTASTVTSGGSGTATSTSSPGGADSAPEMSEISASAISSST